MTKTLFLPGAGGSASFWRPAASFTNLDTVFLSWPGLGDEPPNIAVKGVDDLVDLVLQHMTEPVHIVAQSMGGYVALKVALAAPEKIKRLVLTATSAGLPMVDFEALDWRNEYFDAFPRAARWVADKYDDLSGQFSLIVAPTLLLWGDSDPISPRTVGESLAKRLPKATLQIIEGGRHDLAQTHAKFVGKLIVSHLTICE